MANEDQILQHLNNILSDAHAAKELLGGGVEVPPPGGGGGGGDTYELKTVGRNWALEGTVDDWREALVWPDMGNLAGFTQADIQFRVEVGASFDGLRNFIYLTENAHRWKGDVVLLVNRGANGSLAVSNTLGGAETSPTRAPLPLSAGQVLDVRARLANGVWTVNAGGATVQMQTPALTSTKLRLQLGNSSSDGEDHPVNAGWKLLALTGSVS